MALGLCFGLFLPMGEQLALQFGLIDSEFSSLVIPLEAEENNESKNEEKKETDTDEFELIEYNSDLTNGSAGNWFERSIYSQSWVTEIPSPPPDYVL
ncbi:hypothetical protein OAL15_03580 [Flavobacteriales bacterium]|nr:hypothetical protein [Flavobacteriales bacterium]